MAQAPKNIRVVLMHTAVLGACILSMAYLYTSIVSQNEALSTAVAVDTPDNGNLSEKESMLTVGILSSLLVLILSIVYVVLMSKPTMPRSCITAVCVIEKMYIPHRSLRIVFRITLLIGSLSILYWLTVAYSLS